MGKIIWTKKELEEWVRGHTSSEPPIAWITVGPGLEARAEEASRVQGRISDVFVSFPPRCNGLVWTVVSHNDSVLLPPSVGDNYHNFYRVINDMGDIEKDDKISVVVKNLDTSCAHTIGVRVDVDEEAK